MNEFHVLFPDKFHSYFSTVYQLEVPSNLNGFFYLLLNQMLTYGFAIVYFIYIHFRKRQLKFNEYLNYVHYLGIFFFHAGRGGGIIDNNWSKKTIDCNPAESR